MSYKPILFNTEMVNAILDGRKTQTRRTCKGQGECNPVQCGYHPPFKPGDLLWVRETWYKDAGRYMYRANYTDNEKFFRNGQEVKIRWKPSIHMPREAARIFLRVVDVWVERLQNITLDDVHNEGIDESFVRTAGGGNYSGKIDFSMERFETLWDSTVNPADRDIYGWNANPWVWVIEFERVSDK